MKETFELNAEPRLDQGKGASRRLRRTKMVPAIIYGGDKPPQNLTIVHHELANHLQHEAFYSHILTIKIAGKPEKAVLRALQHHPSQPIVTHVDLLRVSETKVLRVSVPLHFINADICVGVKTGGGLITHLMSQIEVQCLPKDLPEFLEVDLAGLEIGHSVHLSQVTLPKGVEFVALAHGNDAAVAAIAKTRGGISDDAEDAPAAPAAAPAEKAAE